jgi:hypothetical protein
MPRGLWWGAAAVRRLETGPSAIEPAHALAAQLKLKHRNTPRTYLGTQVWVPPPPRPPPTDPPPTTTWGASAPIPPIKNGPGNGALPTTPLQPLPPTRPARSCPGTGRAKTRRPQNPRVLHGWSFLRRRKAEGRAAGYAIGGMGEKQAEAGSERGGGRKGVIPPPPPNPAAANEEVPSEIEASAVLKYLQKMKFQVMQIKAAGSSRKTALFASA